MRKNLYLILITIIVVASLLVAFIYRKAAKPSATNNYNPINTNSPTVPAPQQQANIIIDMPRLNTYTNGTINVSGTVRVFENQFQLSIIGPKGKIIEIPVTAEPSETQYAPFSKTITFDTSTLNDGDLLMLQAFDYSAKDGSVIDLISVPLVFKK